MKKSFLWVAACVGFVALTTEVDAGLLAHWKFDETSGTTAADSAGTNDGTLLDGDPNSANLPVWRPTSGQFGGAIHFNHTTLNHVKVPDFGYGGDGNFSTSIWTKIDLSAPTGKQWWYFWSDGPFSQVASFNYYLRGEQDQNSVPRPDGGKYFVNTTFDDGSGAGTGGLGIVPGSSVGDGQWHMLTVTYSTTDGTKYYVDGVLEASNPAYTGTMALQSGDVFFGARADLNSARVFGGDGTDQDDGLLDDAAIWSFTLTDAQVDRVYRLGAGSVIPEPTSLVLLGLGGCIVQFHRCRRVSILIN